MRLAIIIPANNEEHNIRKVVRKSNKYANVIVVDDGSTDATSSEAMKGGATVLRNETNKGKWSAVKRGFNYALDRLDVDGIIQLDGDGQHDPDDVPKFVQALESGAAVVVGQREFDRAKMPLPRIVSNIISTIVIMILFWIRIADTQCGYRAYNIEALKRMMSSLKGEGFEGETEILIQAKIQRHKIKGVKIRTVYNDEKSKVAPARDIRIFAITATKMRISYLRRQMTLSYFRQKISVLRKILSKKHRRNHC